MFLHLVLSGTQQMDTTCVDPESSPSEDAASEVSPSEPLMAIFEVPFTDPAHVLKENFAYAVSCCPRVVVGRDPDFVRL